MKKEIYTDEQTLKTILEIRNSKSAEKDEFFNMNKEEFLRFIEEDKKKADKEVQEGIVQYKKEMDDAEKELAKTLTKEQRKIYEKFCFYRSEVYKLACALYLEKF